jgi:hypothetical protein
MRKYRVLKKYPKVLMNGSRMVTLIPKTTVYLKQEASVTRLVGMGFLEEVSDITNSPRKPKEQTPKKPSRYKAKPKVAEPKPNIDNDVI